MSLDETFLSYTVQRSPSISLIEVMSTRCPHQSISPVLSKIVSRGNPEETIRIVFVVMPSTATS